MAILSDYTSGVISLAKGSVTVTGTGTMFKTVGLKAGATLLIQNLTAVIVSVDSNTKLTLSEPWTGTSLVNAPYRARFLPDGTTVTATTAALIEMLGNGNLEALAVLISRADMLPYFTGAGAAATTALTEWARTLLAAANGGKGYEALGTIPNDQLPSRLNSRPATVSNIDNLEGNGFYSTTADAVGIPTQGDQFYIMQVTHPNNTFAYQEAYLMGYARITVFSRKKRSGNWEPWQITGLPVLGSVSQASGVPTGAIIQRGNNANGEFVRYADGTQICWVDGISGESLTPFGNVFRDNTNRIWSFPASFSARPSASGSCGDVGAWVAFGTPSNFSSSMRAISGISLSNVEYRAIAIGRWY